MFGHFQQRLFLEGADHDQVDIARHHAGGVGDGLAMAKLHVGPRQHHGLPAHLTHADIETDAGAGRGFLEDQRDHVARQRLLGIRRALGQPLTRGLHPGGLVQHLAQVSG